MVFCEFPEGETRMGVFEPNEIQDEVPGQDGVAAPIVSLLPSGCGLPPWDVVGSLWVGPRRRDFGL